MAVKIVRQPNKIALLGAPTSAAALSAGHEGAPAGLRNAGLIERLRSIGYDVTDLGDDPRQLYKPDDESPRARNVPAVIAALEALKPRVEQAVKSAALPLILSGDCSVALATVAGARRYFRRVSLIYMDRDADLNTPATTPSGSVDGMVVSHLIGRGAAELVRFWGEPPLVREPDLALFGIERLDPSEEEVLRNSTLRSFHADEIKRKGAAATAQTAVDRIHAGASEFVLHLDVDVIAGFSATNYPGSGGLTLEDVREALNVFAQQKNLAALEITAYNPTKDPDGAAAAKIVDLIAGALEKRLETLKSAAAEAAVSAKPGPAVAPPKPAEPSAEAAPKPEPMPETRPGESWSSDTLEEPAADQNQAEAPEEKESPVHASVAPAVDFPSEPPQPFEPSSTPGDDPAPSSDGSGDDSGEPTA
ncbi:MAG TPA: arginase family protein [Candidatus Acidoferrales bacterium]|nr:arginase family protein [Candidatus Acidoferrales bacterium]